MGVDFVETFTEGLSLSSSLPPPLSVNLSLSLSLSLSLPLSLCLSLTHSEGEKGPRCTVAMNNMTGREDCGYIPKRTSGTVYI